MGEIDQYIRARTVEFAGSCYRARRLESTDRAADQAAAYRALSDALLDEIRRVDPGARQIHGL